MPCGFDISLPLDPAVGLAKIKRKYRFNKWYPLAKYKPPKEGRYLFWYISKKGEQTCTRAYWCNGAWVTTVSEMIPIKCVTHWMIIKGPKEAQV